MNSSGWQALAMTGTEMVEMGAEVMVVEKWIGAWFSVVNNYI